MRTPKFNFIPATQLGSARNIGELKVSLSKKGLMWIGKETVNSLGLRDKFIKFYVDIEKKAVAWEIVTKEESLTSLKGIRKITITKAGTCVLSIGTLLKSLKVEDKLPLKGIPVEKYEASYLNKELNYIKL